MVSYKESDMRNRMSARYLGVLLKGVVISLLAPLVLVSLAQAAIQCYECHGGASDYRPLDSGTFGTAGRNDATGAFTGNHQTHMGPITTQSKAVAVCVTCHNPAVSTSGHRDGLIGMSTNINGSAAASTYSKGPSFAQTAVVAPGTCSNANCHFETTTPLWGTTTLSSTGPTTTTCNVCHSSQLSGTPTKAHTTHLNYIGTTLNACASCHPNYNALGANAFWHATSAGQRRINITFAAAPNSGIGTYSGAGDSTAYPSYLPSQSPLRSGTCSATHCHSDGHIENGSGPGLQTNTPGAPAMVASWGSTWSNSHCANCHGDGVSNAWPTYTNTGAATTNANSHQKHMLASGIGCQNCHVATTSDGTTIVSGGGQHIDKSVQVAFNATAGSVGSYAFNTKTCSATTCHGNSSPAWGGATTCASCHESMGAWGTSTDTYNPAHQKHVLATGYDFSCQNCHSAATTGHATGPVTTFQSAEVKYNTTGTAVVSGLYGNSPVNYRTLPSMTTNPYNGAASATPWYTGSTTVWTTDSINPSVKYSAGTCGNVYCHSNAAPVDAANSYVNATWSTTPMTCGSCHGASGSSTKHVKHATTYSITCKSCHDTAVSSNTTISNPSIHVNAVKDVAFNWNSMTTGTYNNTTDTCSNIYCHSPGTANAAPFAAANRVATWTTTLGCDGCHPALGTGMTTLASGSHTRHITDQSPVFGAAFTCDKCHAATVSSNTTISNAANHVNQQVNVNFITTLNLSGLGTYTGSVVPGAANGSCNSVYCHSDGHIENGSNPGAQTNTPGVAALAITWGTPWTTAQRCAACHGDGVSNAWPTYTNTGAATTNANSHQKHMLASGIGCQNCHVATTSDGTTIVSGGGQHIDKSVQVAFNATAGSVGSYAFNTKTCSATTCHGNSSPAWGGATTCASCHESMGAWGTSTDTYNPAHQKHVLATGYDFSCQNCHSAATTGHATGPVTTFQSAEVKYNTTGTAVVSGLYGNSPVNYRTLPSMTTNPYNGAASATPWYTGSTTVWTTDSINPSVKYSAGTCGNIYCHSNAAPVGGINTYVNTAWSTTPMTCNSCHNIGTSGSARHTIHATTYGFTCKSCHDTAVSSNTTISNASIHVNAVKDVAFNYNSLTTGTYNNGTAACSNIYCHSPGTANVAPFAAPVAAVTWTTTIGCDGCHGTFGAGLTSIASRAHPKHIAAGYTCDECHNATAATNTTFSSIGNHVNFQVNVQFNAAAALTTATYMGTTASGTAMVSKAPGSTTGTCTGTCHGSNSGNWGTVSTQATCVTCHGVAGATQAMYSANNNLAAPGYMASGVNTAGSLGVITGNVSNDSKVGAHDVHLRGLGGYSGPAGTSVSAACNDCHAVTALGDTGHMNGSSTLTFSSLARNLGTYTTTAGTLVSTYGAPNCSNVYCHGGAFPAAIRGSGWNTISWVDGTYLANPASSANINDCNKCHQTPPTASTRYAHGGLTTTNFTATSCNGCHNHNGGNDIRHNNGILEAAGQCDSCHNYDLNAGGTWGSTNYGSFGEGSGAHAKHIPYLKARYGVSLISTLDQFSATTVSNAVQKVCGACHTVNGAHHSMALTTNVRQITFGESTQYQFGGSIPTYNGSSITNNATKQKSCSNIDCHYKTSPAWP